MGPYVRGYHRLFYPSKPYRGYGYGYSRGGWAYAAPYYYIPYVDSGYDYDYVGGPDLYSGPPIGPNDPALHMIVEQPPAQSYRPTPDELEAEAAPPPPAAVRQEQPSAAREAKPTEPTTLIFRDGHQQDVTNYAIMGQTVYILDEHSQKIPLTNLDVPATIKANDDRGVEFKVPAVQRPAQKKNSDLQPKSSPDQETPPPARSVASVLP